MSDKVPDWTIEMAREVGVAGHLPTVHLRIAVALLSAYRRGRDEAAEVSDTQADFFDAISISTKHTNLVPEYRIAESALRRTSEIIRRLGEAE